MRHLFRYSCAAGLAFVLLFASACNRGPSAGGARGKVQLKNVQVGLKPGPLSGSDDPLRRYPLYKAGLWTPVLVEIEGKGKLDESELVVETTDSSDVLNNYTIKLPPVEFSAEVPSVQAVTYARPGKPDSNVTVYLRSGGKDVCQPYELTPTALKTSDYLYLTLGRRLPGLHIPGHDDKFFRQSEIAAIENAAELPTQWFGYNTVDLVILTTGNAEFVNGLLDNEPRRRALFEWVQRGGSLVISVSSNQQLLANRPELKPVLPVELTGTLTFPSIRPKWGERSITEEMMADTKGKTPVSVAKMEPKPGRNVRIPVLHQQKTPLVAQANFGLGRITMVAFDLDQAPFTHWKGQPAFWDALLQESGPAYTTNVAKEDFPFGGGRSENDPELLGQMQRGLEEFEGVPVISFWWVALFILLYIIVVGPLDYFLLKRVVKRLELTWVTFPLVVIGVSVAAYFTAYRLKGHDQKINKLDLVDIDLHTSTMQDNVWFSVFSPRIQNYTVTVEPAEQWGIRKDSPPTPLVSWLGSATKGRQSLFRRSYDYEPAAAGMDHVPIQVWATKGFQATWQAPIDPARPPIQANLGSREPNKIYGEITSNLPATLQEVYLIYGKNVYPLNTLTSRNTLRIGVDEKNIQELKTWLVSGAGSVNNNMQFASNPSGRNYGGPPVVQQEPAHKFMRSLLFHEQSQKPNARPFFNAGLRELDQSWRLKEDGNPPGEEAILIGKLAVENGAAKDVAAKPSCVSRLQLGKNLEGTMRQETYVRVFLKVQVQK
ncbi:MAG TPA: hypothetical protein VGZ47_18095 [Gemmataceae bacterium]|nr:hypothetical protein [Gemmataceae bacterium]